MWGKLAELNLNQTPVYPPTGTHCDRSISSQSGRGYHEWLVNTTNTFSFSVGKCDIFYHRCWTNTFKHLEQNRRWVWSAELTLLGRDSYILYICRFFVYMLIISLYGFSSTLSYWDSLNTIWNFTTIWNDILRGLLLRFLMMRNIDIKKLIVSVMRNCAWWPTVRRQAGNNKTATCTLFQGNSFFLIAYVVSNRMQRQYGYSRNAPLTDEIKDYRLLIFSEMFSLVVTGTREHMGQCVPALSRSWIEQNKTSLEGGTLKSPLHWSFWLSFYVLCQWSSRTALTDVGYINEQWTYGFTNTL